MGKKIDLTGQTFNRLTVVEEAGKDKGGRILWNCECSCGNTKVVRGDHLRDRRTQSCDCLRIDKVKEAIITHGLGKHPLYKVWSDMKTRCYNPKSKNYQNYGGMGTTVCDRWKESFQDFYNDVSEGYEKGLELDRTNNDGDYEPANVRWVTPHQNLMNRGSHKDSTSKYKGVFWNKSASKWVAQVTKDGKRHHLGYFTDETEAALAYNEKAKELFGGYACLNIIEN